MKRCVATFLFFLALPISGQQPGSIDSSFQPPLFRERIVYAAGTGNAVFAVTLGPDDEIYVGGHFVGVNYIPWNGVARLHDDGTLDTSFSVPIFDWDEMPFHIDAHAVVVQSNGAVWAGSIGFGSFDFRLPPGGTSDLDEVQTPPVEAIYPDGRFLAASDLVSRHLPDGSLDPDFEPFPWSGSGMRLLPDERIVTVLRSESPNEKGELVYGTTVTVRRPDGTLDTGFPTLTFPGYVRPGIAQRGNGQLYVAGGFTEMNSIQVPWVIRLNQDGTLDPTFQLDPSLADKATNDVVLAIQPNGKLLLETAVTHTKDGPQGGLVRLHSDGSLDGTFDPGTGIAKGNGAPVYPPQIHEIAVQRDGRILVGGDFLEFNGLECDGLVRLLGDPVEPLTLELTATAETGLQLKVSGTADVLLIESANALDASGWRPVSTNIMGAEQTFTAEVNAGAEARFYRARRLP